MKSSSNKTKEIFDRVVKNIQSIVESGEYEKFFKIPKKFKGYSFNNLVLIFSQFPDATRVAGKSKWLNLKREVKKAAKKIWIIAPIPRKGRKKIKKIEEGKEIEVTEEYEYNFYRWVYVYDISQTEGENLPLENKNINSDDMLGFYEKLKVFSRLPIYEENLYGTLEGYYDKKNQKIVIRKSLSANDKVSVLLHELSHAMYDDFDYKTERGLSEVFVESIAYIVADHFGLDTSLCSFSYITKWAKGEPKVIIELGNKIQKCANEFIDKIEKFESQETELVA